jgi:hypothetical protein
MDKSNTKSFSWAKLLINLLTIFSIIAIAIVGYHAFTHKMEPTVGTIGFIVSIVLFICLRKLNNSRSYKYRSPTFGITFWSLVGIVLVATFAGVQPLSDYKDKAFTYIGNITPSKPTATNSPTTPDIPKTTSVSTGQSQQIIITPIIPPTPIVLPTAVPAPTLKPVPIPSPVQPPIPTLKDPTYNQLLSFLQADNTDALPYIYPTFVCDNFASTLQSNAKKAGWRCAKVTLDMTGYTDPYKLGIKPNAGHACNAFQTTDRGLIFIDDTGPIMQYPHPPNNDTIVTVVVGQRYIPKFLFPNGGWTIPDNMGTVTGIRINW